MYSERAKLIEENKTEDITKIEKLEDEISARIQQNQKRNRNKELKEIA